MTSKPIDVPEISTSKETKTNASGKIPLSEEQKQRLLQQQDWSVQQIYHEPTYNYGEDDDDDDDRVGVSVPSDIKFGDLIIVSNRLPITITKDDQQQGGGFQYKKSSGGLVTALTGMSGREFKWIGWTGGEVTSEEERRTLKTDLDTQYNCIPVFLSDKDADDYYNGFSNGILWPLFHYLFEKNTVFNEKYWSAYQKVNQQFADVILENYKEGDMIWVHDYHLMLLPLLLRKKRPDINIAFFLHIPFPSSEIYRVLPVRNQLLEGLLACNFIAFHTYNFARHFMSSCTRTLGIDTSPKGFVHNGVFVNTKAFPIGIDPAQFQKGVQSTACQERIRYFLEKFKGKKIIVGVDRLDYTKGVDLKFLAYEKFLQTYSKYKENTVLIQVGVPTRQDVQEYKELVSTVNELVGRINSTFGTLDGFPVHYINKSVPFPDLCALYSIADALVVTSIRDGMNLVSSEFVVCQDEAQKLRLYEKDVGVLILSEFAGAATSLGGSIIINPYDIEMVSKAMFDALEMGHTERRARHDQNFRIVSTNTATYWGESFMKEFEKSCKVQYASTLFHKHYASAIDQRFDFKMISKEYAESDNRLFLLDYDGTVVDLHKYPSLAIPTQRLEAVLTKLCSDPRNHVYIMTGRERDTMTKFLGHIKGLGLACEHGMRVRHPNSDDWTSLYKFDEVDLTWMKLVKPILEQVSSRTPGSFPEIKDSSLVFHYRNTDPEYGNWQANELKLHLEECFNSAPMDIIKGKKVIEIRPANVNKGIAARRLIRISNADFVFCAGDDNTDEEMFEEAEKFSTYHSAVHQSSPGTPTSATRLRTKSPSVQDFQTVAKHIVTTVVGAQHANYSRAHHAVTSPTDLLDKLEQLSSLEK
jgi:alpha,alpha-trehalose-phosphate synthase [UDP-forming]/trehalose-phosphatase